MNLKNYVKGVHAFCELYLKEYISVCKESLKNSRYKIVGVEKSENSNKYFVVVQINGSRRNVFPKFAPEALVLDDGLLEGFSAVDVRTITTLAYNNCFSHEHFENTKQKTKYIISSHDSSGDGRKNIFTIKNTESNEFLVQTAQELLANKEILPSLPYADMIKVSYAAGTDDILEESLLKDIAKQSRTVD